MTTAELLRGGNKIELTRKCIQIYSIAQRECDLYVTHVSLKPLGDNYNMKSEVIIAILKNVNRATNWEFPVSNWHVIIKSRALHLHPASRLSD